MKDKIELFENIEIVKLIKDNFKYRTIDIVGGSVIDILEDRTPKDYDIIGLTINDSKKLKEIGFEFQYDSKTAITFKFNEIIIQLLKTELSTFDFTISQSKYSINDNGLSVDEYSFSTKKLIPTAHTWESKSKSLNALKRTVHYLKKGYVLPEETFLSLLNNISTKGGVKS